MKLPTGMVQNRVKSNVIGILGARSSGKSSFFGVLINAMMRRYAAEVKFTFYQQPTFSASALLPVGSDQLYRERYGQWLFGPDGHRAIPGTMRIEQNPDLRVPLIYRMVFGNGRSLDLVIFDAAGEDMEDEDILRVQYRYILNAHGLVFLIDPLQFPGVRQTLPESTVENLEPVEPIDPLAIVSRVLNIFEQERGLKPTEKIKVPVVFALSKIDTLRGIVNPAVSSFLSDSYHPGGFNLKDFERASQEIVDHLQVWDSPQPVYTASEKFANHTFTGVSAFGTTPDRDLKIDILAPIRLADPLLWLFYKFGLIKDISDGVSRASR